MRNHFNLAEKYTEIRVELLIHPSEKCNGLETCNRNVRSEDAACDVECHGPSDEDHEERNGCHESGRKRVTISF